MESANTLATSDDGGLNADDATEPPDEIARIVAFRKQHRESQRQFWRLLGVAQSSGSRYEARELPMPLPVRLLVELRLSGGITGEDLRAVRRPTAAAGTTSAVSIVAPVSGGLRRRYHFRQD
ncbi:hypothetical protein WJ542_30995 [Paraburkholderia sp. B3]|uniref:hypothetical protein n=1 Tax=Paraburkholderia sp. B3 TaxID=3134791 RepID=UPI003982C421